MSTYTAAHGHPLGQEHAVDGGPSVDRRWLPNRRVALTASLGLALVLGLVALGLLGLPGGAPTVVLPGAGAGAEAPAVTGTVDGASSDEGGSSSDGPAEEGVGTGPGGTSSADADAVVVHVVGEVVSPGLVGLRPGDRVADAIEAAGGATPTAVLAGLNLARPVVDGEQVVVPAEGGPPPPPDQGGPPGTTGGVLDLNSADAAALDTLPGVGPVLAERIVAWREEHGRFSSVDELVEVSGIGPALLGDVRDLVRAG